jgi:heme/copper-type cytochrome/quinol oxidase subunit 3
MFFQMEENMTILVLLTIAVGIIFFVLNKYRWAPHTSSEDICGSLADIFFLIFFMLSSSTIVFFTYGYVLKSNPH